MKSTISKSTTRFLDRYLLISEYLRLDLILKIASSLIPRSDRLLLRSVCKSWRVSIPEPSSPESQLANILTTFPNSHLCRRFNKPNLFLYEHQIGSAASDFRQVPRLVWERPDKKVVPKGNGLDVDEYVRRAYKFAYSDCD